MTPVMRTTVGLDAEEAEIIKRVQDDNSLEAKALGVLTGITVENESPLSQYVHALLAAGIRAVERQVEESGYHRLAEFRKTDPEHAAWRASRRARHARKQCTA